MKDFIKQRHQELIAGLAEMLMEKEALNAEIEAQKVAISEYELLMKQAKEQE